MIGSDRGWGEGRNEIVLLNFERILLYRSTEFRMQDRIASLEMAQAERKEMAELIELNSALVDKALLVIRSAIANQVNF